jgi:hypothetical protein
MTKNYFRVSICILLLFLSGCAVSTFDIPKPEGALISRPEAEALIPSLFKKEDQSYKALIHAAIQADAEKQTLRYAILRDQKKFRVEVFPTTSFFTLALFITDGEKYLFTDSAHTSQESKIVSSSTLEDLFGLSLSQEELSAVLFGVLPQEGFVYQFYILQDTMRIYAYSSLTDEAPLLFAEVNLSNKVLENMTFLEDSSVRLSVHFKEYDDEKFPKRIHLEIPRFSSTVDLTIQQRKIKPTFSAEQFLLP